MNFNFCTMKTNYLFPHTWKKPGWALFILGILFGFYYLFVQSEPPFFNVRLFALVDGSFLKPYSFFTLVKTNALDEIITVLLLVGGILIAFSKEKKEDEFISKIRLESLVWATYVNYAILLIAVLFFFDLAFLWVLIFNMFTLLFFFIIRFNWLLYKSKKGLRHEEQA